jgi:hypothetical protein
MHGLVDEIRSTTRHGIMKWQNIKKRDPVNPKRPVFKVTKRELGVSMIQTSQQHWKLEDKRPLKRKIIFSNLELHTQQSVKYEVKIKIIFRQVSKIDFPHPLFHEAETVFHQNERLT